MQETVRDFKDRIALLIRERETGKKYSVMGGPRAHDCVVRDRKPTNKKGKTQNAND